VQEATSMDDRLWTSRCHKRRCCWVI
jgi:hypothetical protein